MLEPGQAFGVSREGVGQNFDGHVPVEGRVAGAVDLAHPAGTEGGGDLVGAER